MPSRNQRNQRRQCERVTAEYHYTASAARETASSTPDAVTQPYRQLKVEDALAYLDQIKAKYDRQPHIYNQFLDLMKEFKAQRIDTPGVINCVFQLFHGQRELILGFNTFLPPGYRIEFTEEGNAPRVQLKYPPGMTGPQPAAAAPATAAPPAMAATLVPAPRPRRPAQNKAPIEFDQAINYVCKIKRRFERQPEVYREFLEILHTYQKEQKQIKVVYEQVSTLFKNHTDLLREFSVFLPDGMSAAQLPAIGKFRIVAKVIGRLVLLQRRAAERAYAPGGRGFEMCRDHFSSASKATEPILPVRCLTA